MKSKLLIFSLFLFLQISIFAQGAPAQLKAAPAATAGMSQTQLDKIDNFIQQYVDKNWLPGGVFLIARKGKMVYHKNFGYRSTKKEAYQKDDIFRIASMTKAITTVSIMQLYEQGKLGLDDPIHYYIPAFKEMKVLDSFNEADSSYTTVPANKAITIRQLLTHSSGISYGFTSAKVKIIYEKFEMDDAGLSHDSWTTEELINRIAAIPLMFQPGERFLYGLNMDVLGHIIEVISKKKLNNYFQENIFEPLGMKDTYFYVPKEKHSRVVPVYAYDKTGNFRNTNDIDDPGLSYPTHDPRDHFAGGGGLSSTAKDYAIFIQALVNGGKYNGYRLLGRKAIEVMTSDQMISQTKEGNGFSKIPGITYGLGFKLTTAQGNSVNSKSPGTYEWSGYFNTQFFIDPKEELTFVAMVQIAPFHHYEFWGRLTAMIYSAIDD